MLSFFFESVFSFLSTHLIPIAVLTALAIGLRWLLIYRRKLQQGSTPHEIGIIFLMLYASTIISLTFFPISFQLGSFHFRSALLGLLMGTYTMGSWGLAMTLGNVLMFIPLGFLLPILWRWFRWSRVLALSLASVLFIELLQPLIGRSFDVDDLILNFLGACIGLLLSFVPRLLFPRFIDVLRN